MLFIIACFACDKGDDEDSCTKTSNDFINVSGWLKLESPDLGFLSDVSFLNDDFGLISNSYGRFYKTNSGGFCWEELKELEDEFGGSLFSKFFILNENEIFTSRTGFYKTTDGGETFKEIETNDVWGGSSTFDMHFFNENRGILCKSGINLYKTENGGQTWVNIYPQYGSAQKFQFVSNAIGYLYGGSNFENVNFGEIHKTIDGGETWFKINSEPNIARAAIRSLYFINENLGYFINTLKEFYVTQNGGLTWTLRTSSFDDDYIFDMVFVNEVLGYVIGKDSIFKTEDGGVTWTEDYKSSDASTILNAITKTPNGSIFVVGKNGTLLKKE